MTRLPGDFFVTQIQGATRLAGRTHGWVRLAEFIVDGHWSEWTHAGCILSGGRILEAMPGGARLGWLDQLAEPIAYSSWDLPDGKRTELVDCAYAMIDRVTGKGPGYSFLDYGAIALHAHGLDSSWLAEYICDTGHMICSQLVDDWYTRCGLHPFQDGRWPGYVKPSDLGLVLAGPQSHPRETIT